MKKSILVLMLLCISNSASASPGIATFYTEKSCKMEGNSGIYTQNGERFDEQAFTCALPLRLKYGKSGKNYLVTNLKNGKSIEVRHNDLGPGKGPRKRGVIIDLTPAAFEALGGKIITFKNGNQAGELSDIAVMEIIEE